MLCCEDPCVNLWRSGRRDREARGAALGWPLFYHIEGDSWWRLRRQRIWSKGGAMWGRGGDCGRARWASLEDLAAWIWRSTWTRSTGHAGLLLPLKCVWTTMR